MVLAFFLVLSVLLIEGTWYLVCVDNMCMFTLRC